ncbi:MAG: hypothetical protein AB1450_01290 [Pseudomonadota bacterium]
MGFLFADAWAETVHTTQQPSLFEGLLPLIVLFAVFWFLFVRRRGKAPISFDDYKRKYPKHVSEGKVGCYNCGARDIHIQVAETSPRSRTNVHICRQCGSELYRSKVTH